MSKTNKPENYKSQQMTANSLSTILVTGGCGFIGTNLVRHLSRKGYKIKVLDNLSTGKKGNVSSVDLLVGDVRNRDVVEKAIDGTDAVVHLAAHTDVVESLDNPKEDWDINVNGTLNLLEGCRIKGIKSFIFASSNAVLGDQPPPVDEMKIPRPLSPYGASKLAGEGLCSAYCHSFGLNIISLRFANCYGPYSEHKTSVITRFIELARQGKPLMIYGDGNQTRDFIHVDDICQAIDLCLTTTNLIPGEVFQIASGIETTIKSLANMTTEITGANIDIIHKPSRKGEIERNYSNISKAKRILNFDPKIGLEEGFRKLWNSTAETVK